MRLDELPETLNLQVSVHHITRGSQERSYGPTVNEALLHFAAANAHDLPSEAQVKALAQTLVCSFTEDKPTGTMDDHFRSRLKVCERLDDEPLDAIWRVRIEYPFTD